MGISQTIELTGECSYQDPFEEYKTRLARKLARREETDAAKAAQAVQKETTKDETNWFGQKVGSTGSSSVAGAVPAAAPGGGGVGKYLNLKRPADGPTFNAGPDDTKKKRKTGFGDFSGW